MATGRLNCSISRCNLKSTVFLRAGVRAAFTLRNFKRASSSFSSSSSSPSSSSSSHSLFLLLLLVLLPLLFVRSATPDNLAHTILFQCSPSSALKVPVPSLHILSGCLLFCPLSLSVQAASPVFHLL
ncbi:hypothetical protein E2C01_020058 [Portunus trituberculatus]|uniref:Uncharacterized protein n=1 Tax=Portunus trituberculatus TaxID=210409 RepID=A0A5B7E0Q3_PORTR|nr:hypothetical protein [Portunus trituberculatus]